MLLRQRVTLKCCPVVRIRELLVKLKRPPLQRRDVILREEMRVLFIWQACTVHAQSESPCAPGARKV